MIYEQRTPCTRLKPFVQAIVYHQHYCPGHTRERILAYGAMDVIIDLSETPKYVFDNESLASKAYYRRGWIAGMRCEPITIECGSGAAMLVIQFKPGGAWAFFGFPMGELTDHIEECDHIWGSAFHELRERLMGHSPQAILELAERWLLGWAGDRLEPNPFIDHALRVIASNPKPPSMRELASLLGYTQKHLISLFDKLVGISPKRFSRIVRFQKVVHALEAGRPRSWSQFAQGFGFYDQAHFNNEFKAFAAMTPEVYMNRKGPFLNFVPAD